MSSGFGLNGGPSRCFPFWQEVLACYVVNTSAENDSGKAKCIPVLEDYYECLHHRKEATKTLALQAEYRKRLAENPNVERQDPSEVRNLGLLEASNEQKYLKTAPLLPFYKSNNPK